MIGKGHEVSGKLGVRILKPEDKHGPTHYHPRRDILQLSSSTPRSHTAIPVEVLRDRTDGIGSLPGISGCDNHRNYEK
jgi:hypothetical protein